jgi:hypothetical protein
MATTPITQYQYLWTQSEADRLGTLPDAQLAQQMLISEEEVRFMRIKLLISMHRTKWNDDITTTKNTLL